MAKSKSGGNPRTIPEDKTQVNFNIYTKLFDKVKDLVFWTDNKITNSDVFNKATEKYLSDHEKKHGKIKRRQMKKD